MCAQKKKKTCWLRIDCWRSCTVAACVWIEPSTQCSCRVATSPAAATARRPCVTVPSAARPSALLSKLSSSEHRPRHSPDTQCRSILAQWVIGYWLCLFLSTALAGKVTDSVESVTFSLLNRLTVDLDFCTCMGRSPGIEYHRTHAVYTVSQNNIATALSVTSPNGQMFTDFQNSFTVRLSSKFAIKSCLKISPRLDHVATVPCEIYKFKNRHAQGVSAAKCRVRLCHSKTVSKHVSGEISSI